jgi:hypothetical protein
VVFIRKPTREIPKQLRPTGHKLREQPYVQVVLWMQRKPRTIHEHRLLAGVTMEVEIEADSLCLFSMVFDHRWFWVQSFVCVFSEHPINVKPCKWWTRVPYNNSINVQYRYYLENSTSSQLPCLFVLREKKPDQSMDYPWCVCLPWVHPAIDYDCFLVGFTLEVCNRNHRYCDST